MMRLKKVSFYQMVLFFLPIIAVVGFFLLRQYAPVLVKGFPNCYFRKITGLYCPACGNTRSVLMLLQGDILSALRFNVLPFILCFILVSLYLEQVLKQFSVNCQLMPRSGKFWSCFFTVLFLYFIVRNKIAFLVP